MTWHLKFGWTLASALFVGAALPLGACANPVEAPHLQASLVTMESSVVPGESLTAAVHFELEPEWHLYWKNPGDSGEAPSFDWRLPEGFVPGEVAWPAPSPIPVGPLMNYGYEGELLLPVTIEVPKTFGQQAPEGADVELSVVATWLVCREDCIPGEAALTLTLPVRSKPTPPRKEHSALFAQVEREQPTPVGGRAVDDGDAVIVDIAVDTSQLGDARRVTLFPYDALVLDHAAEQEVDYHADGVSLRVRKDPTRDKPLEALAGLIVLEGDDARRVFELDTTVIRRAAPDGSEPDRADIHATPTSPEDTPPAQLVIVLLLAFAGGVLLNLMPCVFPVLSLKILGVLKHADNLNSTRRDGRTYTAGVLVSFWIVAGLLLVLRAGGERLGWGFQLQSPEFVATLIILMTLVALNLLGAFEVGIGFSRLGAMGATAPTEEPSERRAMLSSFVTGALAVIVATPCTAPFMGTAVGFALTRSAGVAFLVFTALGLGMAAPYLALGYFPRIVRRLPRPGAWMVVLRQVLAFPMFATAIWLLTVLAALTDESTAFRLLGGLLVVALGAWVYGLYQRSSSRPVAMIAMAVVLVAGGVVFGTRGVEASESRAASRSEGTDDLWEPWSAARVAELRAEGRPVLVNFTADWCISCKANEIVVFQADAVRDALEQNNVAALKADWTRRDEAITKELQAHGRAGVPLYLYYPPDSEAKPSTLPSVLTPGIVLAELDRR